MKIVKIVPNTHQFIKSKNFVKKTSDSVRLCSQYTDGIAFRVDTIVKLSSLFTSSTARVPVYTRP